MAPHKLLPGKKFQIVERVIAVQTINTIIQSKDLYKTYCKKDFKRKDIIEHFFSGVKTSSKAITRDVENLKRCLINKKDLLLDIIKKKQEAKSTIADNKELVDLLMLPLKNDESSN